MFRMVVTTGPERGKVFEPDEELVHVGRGPENQIVLEDPSIGEHHASFLSKNGRYAIYRPDEADVLVDGSDIPAEKWVWLPTDVRLQFGRRTSCHLNYEEPLDAGGNGSAGGTTHEPDGQDAAEATSADAAVATAAPAPKPPPLPGRTKQDAGPKEGKSKAERKRRKSAKSKRQTARFITDRGDTLVELGADGHLPELSLEDGPARKQKRDSGKKTGPALMYCVLGLSFVCSIGMLLIEPASESVSEMSRADARAKIAKDFFGDDKKELQDWQVSLRAARLAYSRRDYVTEIAEYRKVLKVLNSEDRDEHIGVTGHLDGDVELRRLIGIIISR